MNMDLKEESHVKALLLAAALPTMVQENPLILLKEYKKGNIKIHKETLMFKILKSIPTNLITKITPKIPQNI